MVLLHPSWAWDVQPLAVAIKLWPHLLLRHNCDDSGQDQNEGNDHRDDDDDDEEELKMLHRSSGRRWSRLFSRGCPLGSTSSAHSRHDTSVQSIITLILTFDKFQWWNNKLTSSVDVIAISEIWNYQSLTHWLIEWLVLGDTIASKKSEGKECLAHHLCERNHLSFQGQSVVWS